MDKRTKKQTIFMSSIPWRVCSIIFIFVTLLINLFIIFYTSLLWYYKLLCGLIIILFDMLILKKMLYKIDFFDKEMEVKFFRKKTIKYKDIKEFAVGFLPGYPNIEYRIDILLKNDKTITLFYFLVSPKIIFCKVDVALPKVEKLILKIKNIIYNG